MPPVAKCQECDFEWHTVLELFCHLKETHRKPRSPAKIIFKCLYCNETYGSEVKLQEHLDTLHAWIGAKVLPPAVTLPQNTLVDPGVNPIQKLQPVYYCPCGWISVGHRMLKDHNFLDHGGQIPYGVTMHLDPLYKAPEPPYTQDQTLEEMGREEKNDTL